MKTAEDRFKITSIAPDLTPKQRSEKKKLLEEAKSKYVDDPEQENFRFLVVGQQSRMRVIRVKRRE